MMQMRGMNGLYDLSCEFTGRGRKRMRSPVEVPLHFKEKGKALCFRPPGRSFLRRNLMIQSTQIKPISYLKAHAAKIVRHLADQGKPLVITQNGDAKVVMLDVESYEKTQEILALLKVLALGMRQIEEGKVQPAENIVEWIRARRKSH